MPPIEVGPARAIRAIEARLARAAGGEALPGANGVAANRQMNSASVAASTAVETSDALDPGAAPVDTGRVEAVRTAIASGTYQVSPGKIADAMIAAGALQRSPQ
jgi:negative regulator of flagellin synthesis FlgM